MYQESSLMNHYLFNHKLWFIMLIQENDENPHHGRSYAMEKLFCSLSPSQKIFGLGHFSILSRPGTGLIICLSNLFRFQCFHSSFPWPNFTIDEAMLGGRKRMLPGYKNHKREDIKNSLAFKIRSLNPYPWNLQYSVLIKLSLHCCFDLYFKWEPTRIENEVTSVNF